VAEPNINKAYTWAIQTCNAPNVGYSQAYRNQRTVNGVTYYDCSSFVWYALIAGGFDCVTANGGSTWPFTTSTMASVLTKLGFTEVDASGEYLPGDIGLSSGHTEMCYQGGSGSGIFMGAHTANAALAFQVSIGNSSGDTTYTRSFTRIFRYGDGGAVGYGSSAYVCAAMAGNFWQESNINPGVWEGLSEGTWTDLLKGYGLGQWTNTGGDTHGRLYQMYEWVTGQGYDVASGTGQCAYIVEENTWYQQQEASSFASLSEFLSSDSTDLEALTHAWNIGWEGIHDSSWDDRVEYAEKCYDYITEHAQDPEITVWIVGNRYLSEDEILNNAVMLYRYFSSGGGGGGTPSKRKKKMPIWMWIRYKY